MEEQGYVKNGAIGPSRAVRVIKPRIKKIGFYDWESRLTKAQAANTVPWSHKSSIVTNPDIQKSTMGDKSANQKSKYKVKDSIKFISTPQSSIQRSGIHVNENMFGNVSQADSIIATDLAANNDYKSSTFQMPKSFLWQKGLSHLFVDETKKRAPNIRHLKNLCE